MRIYNFAKRNFKEITRDPLSIVFSLLLPLFLLFIFQQINIPSENYDLENFTPGIVVFGFSFITLFTAMLVSKDRTSSLLIRLGISPMKSMEYIGGYILSIFPLILVQNILFFLLAFVLGLNFSMGVIWAVLSAVLVSVIFIALGIIIGSLCTEKASSGVSSIVIQLVCFTSGMYFPRELLGKGFAKVCEYLPFESCVTVIKGIMNSNTSIITNRNIIVLSIYVAIVFVLAVMIFKKKMISDNK